MAINYSLICFGGRLGKVVTFTVAGGVVNLTNHGLRDGKGVVFTSSGALPVGLSAGDVYYVRSTSFNTFTLHETSADALVGTAQVVFTNTGSGTHIVRGEYFLGLSAGQLARYGAPGAERIYDSLLAWHSARNPVASEYDEEWAEIGEAFTERSSSQLTLSMQAARIVITPTVAGQVTEAFHGGVFGSGYVKEHTASNGSNIQNNSYASTIEGVELSMPLSSATCINTPSGCTLDSLLCRGGGTNGVGIAVLNQLVRVTNCVSMGFAEGMRVFQYGIASVVANNLFTKNVRGIYTNNGVTSQINGYYYNNISVGNSLSNWFTQAPQVERASHNVGEAGDSPWVKGTGVTLTASTTDFVDWANDDFRLTPGSTLIDAGVSYFGVADRDVAWRERPAYAGGATEQVDVGPYEADLGFGLRPASHTVTLLNVVPGSRVLIEAQNGSAIHFNELSPGSTLDATVQVYGDERDQWLIKVRKASESPYYVPWQTQANVTEGTSTIFVSQTPDE